MTSPKMVNQENIISVPWPNNKYPGPQHTTNIELKHEPAQVLRCSSHISLDICARADKMQPDPYIQPMLNPS